MNIYLPIAEIAVDPIVIVLIGGGIGILSGIFGVGGGFLATPLLIFMGVPPTVAVGTQTSQIVGQSVSGALAQFRRGLVDLRMGAILTVGGLAGAALGVGAFALLRRLGHIDFVIAVGYVLFLIPIGVLMLIESAGTIWRRLKSLPPPRRSSRRSFLHGLPMKMRFRQSRLYVSALLPLIIGLGVGFLAALLGIGGGFLLIPALIYLVGMPPALVVGTSFLQIIVTTAAATWLQAVTNQSVDLVLAALLLLGGTIGAQLGARAAAHLPGSELRGLLALLILGLGGKMLIELIATPQEMFSIVSAG